MNESPDNPSTSKTPGLKRFARLWAELLLDMDRRCLAPGVYLPAEHPLPESLQRRLREQSKRAA